jgi:THAP domain
MSNCAVVFCTANSASKDKIELLETPIEVDDAGSVLDGLDTKFYCLPSIPQKGTSIQIQEAKERHQQWVHRLGRGDQLPKNRKNIYICSRHFGKEAYNQQVPLRQGLGSILEVARRHPKVQLLLATAVPTLNLPKWNLPKDTERSQRQMLKAVGKESLESPSVRYLLL